MAAVRINITVVDKKGKSSKTSIPVPLGFTLSQYAEAGVALGQLVADLSEGQITEINVSIPVDISAATIRAAAMAAADVAKKLLIVARNAAANLLARFNIPTYDEINTVIGSDQADTTDPGIAALISIIEDGVNVAGVFIQPVALRGEDLDEVLQTREIFRRFN